MAADHFKSFYFSAPVSIVLVATAAVLAKCGFATVKNHGLTI